MNIRLVLQILGKVLLICALLMIPSIAVSLIYADRGLRPLFIGALCMGGLGGALQLFARPKFTTIRSREGFAVVGLSWLLLGVLGAIPFYLCGGFSCFTDCLFETVSGLTTTGATVLTDVESLPKGILFWRSFTHWIGGMGILVLTMALIPQLGPRSLFLLRAESTGPSPDKLVPRTSSSAKTLYIIYIALSFAEYIALRFCGMNIYDACIHTFSTAGTGGFSSYSASIGYFNSTAVNIVISAFMLLFSVNFTLFYRLLHKDWKTIVHSSETRVFFILVAGSSLLITFGIRPMFASFGQALEHSFFQVSSIVSTTGFSTQDFTLWPLYTQIILLGLMIVGGCAGSTSGGIKVLRAIILCKGVGREVRSLVHPRSVHVIKLDGHPVDEDIVASVSLFFFAYLALAFVAMLIVSLNGFDFATSATSVLACITDTGPGLGLVGPSGNFSGMNILSKLTLTACMLLGRLDIYPILLFFTMDAWRHN